MAETDPRKRRCLVVFTKPARPGRVKTRLIGDLTAKQAANLHKAFLEDLVERMKSGPFSMELAWQLDTNEAVPQWGGKGFRQVEGDLGTKLMSGLRRAGGRATMVAAIGSDHPDLPIERVTEAFEALEAGSDLALGPATDGGYYLIAAAHETLIPELFRGIPWSSEAVLSATLERAERANLKVKLLPEGEDVDTPADLHRLALRLSTGTSCARTRALLLGWDLLPQGEIGRT